MAFKTAAEIFGDGGGFGPAVPYATTNPPGTNATNRGIQFGEQLTAAIANRTHYALAQNDENLNTRLAVFETGGLDAAYDNGSIGPAGGGREITKNGGAVETISTLAAQYADDIANAHFRANQIGDAVRGGIGFESVGYGRLGSSPIVGLLDRRAMNFAGVTVVADTIASTLANPNSITVGAGQLRDGSSNTHLIAGYDLIEILDGVDAGLYVLQTLTSGTACTVLALDGSTPSFTPGAANIRVFRATFGTFNRYGQIGTFSHQGVAMIGYPGQEAVLDLVPGSTLGRYDALLSSPDGARYALRARWKNALGAISTRFELDSQGQVQSYVSSSQLTAAQLTALQNFGAPAFVVQQDESNQVEVGYFAKSIGDAEAWMGAAIVGDARTAVTPSGVFAFNFINTTYNVDLTDVEAADWKITPGVTLVEILTPTAQAGVYRVTLRDANNGEMELSAVDSGATPPAFPTTGAGTLRILYGAFLGQHLVVLPNSIITGTTTTTRAAAMLAAPKQVGGTALLLETGNENADPPDHFFVRGVSAEDGSSSERFAIDATGRVAGRLFQADTSFDYKTPISRSIFIPAWAAMMIRSQISANMPWYASVSGVSPTQGYSMASLEIFARLIFPLNRYLPHGAVVSELHAIVQPGAARLAGNRMALFYTRSTKADVTANAAPTHVGPLEDSEAAGIEEDAGNTNWQQISVTGLSETVTSLISGVQVETLYATVIAGDDADTNRDEVFGLRVVFTDPGPRNY